MQGAGGGGQRVLGVQEFIFLNLISWNLINGSLDNNPLQVKCMNSSFSVLGAL